MPTVAPLSSTSPVNYQTALTRAFQLVSAFKVNSLQNSVHYPHVRKQSVANGLTDTLNYAQNKNYKIAVSSNNCNYITQQADPLAAP